MKKKYLLWIIAIVLSIVLSIFPMHRMYDRDSLFKAWNDITIFRPAISKMLVKNEYLMGLKKDKVIQLLGKPSEITDSKVFVYAFKRNYLIFGDTFLLSITFDKNDTVSGAGTFTIDD